jgi:predicted nucleic acid-binding Zn ribbon protein
MTGDIWNTICPVCGTGVPHDMPLIELARASAPYHRTDDERPGLRLCSGPCASIAQSNPEKYRAIALSNVVAGSQAPPSSRTRL